MSSLGFGNTQASIKVPELPKFNDGHECVGCRALPRGEMCIVCELELNAKKQADDEALVISDDSYEL